MIHYPAGVLLWLYIICGVLLYDRNNRAPPICSDCAVLLYHCALLVVLQFAYNN